MQSLFYLPAALTWPSRSTKNLILWNRFWNTVDSSQNGNIYSVCSQVWPSTEEQISGPIAAENSESPSIGGWEVPIYEVCPVLTVFWFSTSTFSHSVFAYSWGWLHLVHMAWLFTLSTLRFCSIHAYIATTQETSIWRLVQDNMYQPQLLIFSLGKTKELWGETHKGTVGVSLGWDCRGWFLPHLPRPRDSLGEGFPHCAAIPM